MLSCLAIKPKWYINHDLHFSHTNIELYYHFITFSFFLDLVLCTKQLSMLNCGLLCNCYELYPVMHPHPRALTTHTLTTSPAKAFLWNLTMHIILQSSLCMLHSSLHFVSTLGFEATLKSMISIACYFFWKNAVMFKNWTQVIHHPWPAFLSLT